MVFGDNEVILLLLMILAISISFFVIAFVKTHENSNTGQVRKTVTETMLIDRIPEETWAVDIITTDGKWCEGNVDKADRLEITRTILQVVKQEYNL